MSQTVVSLSEAGSAESARPAQIREGPCLARRRGPRRSGIDHRARHPCATTRRCRSLRRAARRDASETRASRRGVDLCRKARGQEIVQAGRYFQNAGVARAQGQARAPAQGRRSVRVRTRRRGSAGARARGRSVPHRAGRDSGHRRTGLCRNSRDASRHQPCRDIPHRPWRRRKTSRSRLGVDRERLADHRALHGAQICRRDRGEADRSRPRA